MSKAFQSQEKVEDQGCFLRPYIKVQLTPKNFFHLYKSPCFSDHRCEKIIVVAMLVNFL